jgi:hypothetical protein
LRNNRRVYWIQNSVCNTVPVYGIRSAAYLRRTSTIGERKRDIMANEMPRKEKLTLDELVNGMRDTWLTRVRDGQLYAFQAGSHVLEWARENETDFLTYCGCNGIVGDTHQTRVVELMLSADPDGEDSEGQPTISRERRAEYAACVAWFADRELCPETDPDKAVALARQKGRITGIAREYREKKDAENPKAKVAKQKGQATKARRSDAASAAAAAEIIAASASAANGEARERPVFLTRDDRTTGEATAPMHDESGGVNQATELLAFLARKGIAEAGNIISVDNRDGPDIRIMLDIRDESASPTCSARSSTTGWPCILPMSSPIN